MKLNAKQKAQLKGIASWLVDAADTIKGQTEATDPTGCDVEMLEAALSQIHRNHFALEQFLEEDCYTENGDRK